MSFSLIYNEDSSCTPTFANVSVTCINFNEDLSCITGFSMFTY